MSRFFFAGVLTLTVFVCSWSVYGQQPMDLSGKWKSGEGEVVITQNGAGIQANLVSGGECPYGGSRSYYIQSELQGNLLRGAIMLCTQSKQLLEECHMKDPYTAKFEATVDKDTIRGTFRPDYIHYDTKDGHFLNCSIAPGGGGDRSFDLARASDCCDQVQQLQAQVKSLEDRLKQLEQKLNGTLNSEGSSIHIGKEGISINSSGNITIKSDKDVTIKGANIHQN